LLVDSGLRISEAIGLRIGDVDRGVRTATVLGKGRKVRTVPFGRQTARALGSYLALHPQADTADAPLFLTDAGDPLVRRRAQHIISGMARRAGITDRRVGPHALRRTFASLWISNGGDPFTLQRILGHTSMEMVNRYVRLSAEALSRSHAVSGPLDRLIGG
jgi:integrase/recombinase XerD